MKNSQIILAAGLLLWTITGCIDHQNRDNLSKVRHLQTVCDSLDDVFSSIDLKKFHNIEAEITKNVSYVSKNIESFDPHDSLFVNYFGSYAATGKTISRLFRSRVSSIEPGLEFSESQLKKLKHDIRKQAIPDKDSVQQYILSEKKALDDLSVQISEVKELFDQELRAYQQTKNKVQQLLEQNRKQKTGD